jgi:hypothetical protein
MKKISTILVIMLLSVMSFNVRSQGVDWLKKYDGVMYYTSDIAPGLSGDVYACATTETGTSTYGSFSITCNSNYNVNITRIDASGNVSLVKNLGDQPRKCEKITVDGSGNVICFGTYTGSCSFDTYTLTGGCGYVCKMNSSGVVQWAQSLGISPTNLTPYAVRNDPAGNIFCGAMYSGTITAGTFSAISLSYDGLVLKLDANGTSQWLQSVGGPKLDVVTDISFDNVGNLYAIGVFSQTAVFGTNTLTAIGDYDGFICKYTNSGNMLWAKRYGYYDKDIFQTLSHTNGDKMYLVGWYNFNTVVGTSTLTNYFGTPNYVAKMDTAGNVLWAKQFGATTPTTTGAFIHSGVTDGSDVVYLLGTIQGTMVCFGSSSLSCLTSSVTNEFVTKLDGNGNFSWVKRIKSDMPLGYDIPVMKEKNGKLFVSGDVPYSNSMSIDNYTLTGGPYVTGSSGSKYYLRLNPAVIGIEEYQNYDHVNVYPNPVGSNGTIVFEDLESTSNKIILSDIAGKFIVNADLVNNQLPLSNYHIAPGVYILKVNSGSLNAVVRKIVVE